MKAIVISESLIIRKGIVEIIKDECICRVDHSHLYTDIYNEEYDLVLLDLSSENLSCLDEVMILKHNKNTKIIIIDFNEDKMLFSTCVKNGVDAYILAKINSEDIGYAVRRVIKGKKYYDAGLIESYVKTDEVISIGNLTKREKEVLIHIARGKSNLDISRELYITEYTVKKHISNIFAKLNLRDRMQAAIYAYDNKIVSL